MAKPGNSFDELVEATGMRFELVAQANYMWKFTFRRTLRHGVLSGLKIPTRLGMKDAQLHCPINKVGPHDVRSEA